MRKLFVSFIVVVLAITVSLTVFAQDAGSNTVNSASSSQQITVGVNVQEPDLEKVYSVEVEWTNMTFTYNYGDDARWDPETHSINKGSNPTWDNQSATIKLTNHSNAAVGYKAQFEGKSNTATANGVTATLSNDSGTLLTAVGTERASAPNKTINLDISGTPDTTGSFDVGTITVSLTAGD